jgi:catechol 2,3-dioxygenase-like lactoylglutathione lyase family enzyme
MTRTSWVELCVSDFEQSITWFERVLGFRVVARDANDYAELSCGETFIQLAADHAPYWESERPHLLPAGQRGSGVEIVLLVENADAVYRQAQQAQADIVRPLADYPWHLRQFWVRHPDGYLIRPAQRLLSVNPTVYRRQVGNAFEQGLPRIREALLPIKQTADQLILQGDAFGAATIYETMVNEICAHSHLYYEEDDYDDYEGDERYYPQEEGLEELVTECVEALGNLLADPRSDRVVREKIGAALFAIYQRDVNADESHDFGSSAADYLVQYMQPLERQALAAQVHALLSDEDEGIVGRRRPIYGQFLLDLERDTLDDEAYLRICRETGRISDLVERLLTLGRIDEAVEETEQRSASFLTHLADLFLQHGHETLAERLVRVRLLKENPNDLRILLEWLRKYYQARDNATAELEIAERQFRLRSSLRGYQELRALAERLQRWDTLRPELLALLEPARDTTLLIEIALDEGDIDGALQRLQGMARQDRHGYIYDDSGYYGRGSIALTVAKKAEESRPRAAIELYRQYAERLIALRDRKNYQEASEYLVKVRALYEKLGEMDDWAQYIAALREQNRALRALKEELARVGL